MSEIMTVDLFGNGNVMCFGRDGQQISKYQAFTEKARRKVVADAPADAGFYWSDWQARTRSRIGRAEWLHLALELIEAAHDEEAEEVERG